MAVKPDPRRYHRIRYRLAFIGLVWRPAVLLVFFALSRAYGADLLDRFDQLQWGFSVKLFWAVVWVECFAFVLTLPISYYRSYRLEREYSLSNQTPAGWLIDSLKAFFLGTLFHIATLECVLGIFRFRDPWDAPFIILILFTLSVFVAWVFPTLLVPLFFKMKSLAEGALKTSLRALADECSLSCSDIFEIKLSAKTNRANAAVLGIGSTRRIVLGDTLLGSFTPDEIQMVMAHEIGHVKLRHSLRWLGWHAAALVLFVPLLERLLPLLLDTLGGAWTNPSNYAALMALYAVCQIPLIPLANGLSRLHEYEADRYALTKRPQGGVFESTMNKLAQLNLADVNPHRFIEWFFFSHPSIHNRIINARSLLLPNGGKIPS